MKTLRINVYGRVQGVFFRASTKEMADELGVNGWVRNETDGSVSITATSDEATLKAFVEWCRKGPMMAKVDRIELADTGVEDYPDFSILH